MKLVGTVIIPAKFTKFPRQGTYRISVLGFLGTCKRF